METITCAICGYSEEVEDNTPVDYLPDGYILPGGIWICDDCGSCPECGRTLEKGDEDKRAHIVNGELIKAELCEDCVSDLIAHVVSLHDYLHSGNEKTDEDWYDYIESCTHLVNLGFETVEDGRTISINKT